MKVIIDENCCKKHGLTLQDVLLVLVCSTTDNVQQSLDSLLEREVIAKPHDQYLITQDWHAKIEEILNDSKATEDNEERLRSLAMQMRKCFPEGKMPNTPYYYRCNNTEVVRKLKGFFLKYGNYTDEEILDATQRFVSSFEGNLRYMPLIKYFISKVKPVQDEDGRVHNVEHSPLADYLENKEDPSDLRPHVADPETWMMNVKN